jgi:molybdopterin-guanine dinucleotide biosynthesis protein
MREKDAPNGENAWHNLVLIGSTGRNAGKTTLAVALIKKLREQGRPVNAAKVITVERKGSLCPRGGQGCGACSLDSDFVLCEEYEAATGKDTSQLLDAGAGRVFLLRSLKQALPGAFAAMCEKAGDALLIVESNSLRAVTKPALFVMLSNSEAPPKPSARAVMQAADITVNAPFTRAALNAVFARLPQHDNA